MTGTDLVKVDPQTEGTTQSMYGNLKPVSRDLLETLGENIAFLRYMAELLEDNKDPEMRQRFVPVLVDYANSHGVALDSGNDIFKFNESSNISYEDYLTFTKVRVYGFTLADGQSNTYVTDLGTVAMVSAVTQTDTGDIYTSKTSISQVESTSKSYYADVGNRKLYVHTSDGANPDGNPGHIITVTSKSPTTLIDNVNTTAHLDLVNGKITVPTTRAIGDEVIDIDNATDSTHTTIRPCTHGHRIGLPHNYPHRHRSWLLDIFSEKPDTEHFPSKVVSQVFQAGQSGLLTKVNFAIQINKEWGILHGHLDFLDDVWLEIRPVDGNNKPLNTVMAREKVPIVPYSCGINAAVLHGVIFNHPPTLVSGTKYAIVVRAGIATWDYGISICGYHLHAPGVRLTNSFTWVSDDNGLTWYGLNYGERNYAMRDFQFQTYVRVPDSNPYDNTKDFYVYWKPFKCNPINSVTIDPEFALNGGTIVWQVSSDPTSEDKWHTVTSAGGWSYTFTGNELGKNQVFVRAKLTSASTSTTPEITGLEVTASTDGAIEGYLRTQFYVAKPGQVLGGKIWSNINAPHNIVTASGVNVDVKVDIIKGTPLPDKFTCTGSNNVFTLTEYPAQPLLGVSLTKADGSVINYTEDIHYTVDYGVSSTAKRLTFISNPEAGLLTVTYNPLFMKNLSASDFQDGAGNWTGLKVDLMEQEFTVVNNGDAVYQMRAVMLEPVHEVTITHNGSERTVYEGSDYTVDYYSTSDITTPPYSVITFLRNEDMVAGDKITVKFTPNLTENGLALGYRLTRSSLTGTPTPQVEILPCWFQMRV